MNREDQSPITPEALHLPAKKPWYFDILALFQTLLISPVRFFASMPPTGKLNHALTFALVVHWIGAIGMFFWKEMMGQDLDQWLKQFRKFSGEGGFEFLEKIHDPSILLFLKLGPVLADPISVIFTIFLSSAVIYIATRLLVDAGKHGAPSELRFETIAKIHAYAYAPSIFLLVPFIGPAIYSVWSFVILVQGVKTVYHVTTIRSLVIVLFPALVIAGLLMTSFFALLLIGFKLFGSLLSGF